MLVSFFNLISTGAFRSATRLYDPTAGQILLDGIDLRSNDVDDLRREIGVILQDYMRHDLAVRENIGFGNVSSIDEPSRIETAAEKCLAKIVIDRLPLGYGQMVARRFEGGVALSGGERRKFAPARAYLARRAMVDSCFSRPPRSTRAEQGWAGVMLNDSNLQACRLSLESEEE